jgi:urate oxidase
MTKNVEYFEKSDYESHTNMEYRHIWVKVSNGYTNKFELVQTSAYAWKVYKNGKLVLDNVPQKDIIDYEPSLARALNRQSRLN